MVIDVSNLLYICGAITTLVGFGFWVTKPVRDLTSKIDNLEKQVSKNNHALEKQEKVNKLHIKTQSVILEHLRTNNATGKMADCYDELQEFLVEEGSSVKK